jgi:hypothetical protein
MQPEQEPTAPTTPATAQPAEPKPIWDTVLTTTPVVLTVLGTVLAGLSTSEMTLAQYYRTLAAQSQSKVGDQWGFYQAKRIRGTTMDAVLDLLPVQARPGKVRYAALLTALLRLQHRQEAAQQSLNDFIATMNKHKTELPAELSRMLGGWSKELERLGQDRCSQLNTLMETCRGTLVSNADLKRAMTLVTENRWDDPDGARTHVEGPVEEAVTALRENKTDAELSPFLHRIKPDEVRAAIEKSEDNARKLAASMNRTTRVIDQLAASIADQLQRTSAFHEQIEPYEDLVGGGEKLRQAMPADITAALTKLKQSDSAVMTAADDLKNVFTAMEKTFTSRRYKLEAEDNQHIAYLYELQVRLESRQADRHRHRSMRFFYGMLAAQAGVAISSLALAARQKSVLWALAGLAGLTALVFSLYVYLYM